jgi:hypothetical protein
MSTPLPPASELGQSAPHCPKCDAPLAADQRYCLNCGQRLTEPRVGFEQALGLTPEPPVSTPRAGFWDRRGPVILFAGVVAIVIALGVGVVIGRGNSPTAVAAKPTIVTVPAAAPASSTAASGTAAPVAATKVHENWPASASGWTVELSTLPNASAQPSDITAAEAVASSKGARAVAVLNGDSHRGTPRGTYVIYSGHYSTQQQAEAAKAKLKRSFPNAIVLHVTPSGAGAGSSKSASSQVSKVSKLSGSAAVKASSKLPSTLATGGAPPPKDKKKPGGGSGSGSCIGC